MPAKLPRTARVALRQLTQSPRTSSPSSSFLATAATAQRTLSTTPSSQYASAAAMTQMATQLGIQLPTDHIPATKPPSARPPETRKSQLIRTYTSLLRSTPLILFFQNNNLTAVEWAAVRRELRAALAAVPVADGSGAVTTAPDITSDIHFSVLRTRMFNVALKIVSFFDSDAAAAAAPGSAGPASPSAPQATQPPFIHDLSTAAYEATRHVDPGLNPNSDYAQLSPLLVGPTAALVFPAVSPQHVAAALKILAPGARGSAFAPPKRKNKPSYYEADCQSGINKLILIGGRIDGSVFDVDGVKWVGGIEGGLDGLRAQLVTLLQSAGLGLTSALEAGGKSLWMALEGRKVMLEDEGKEGKEGAAPMGKKEEGEGEKES